MSRFYLAVVALAVTVSGCAQGGLYPGATLRCPASMAPGNEAVLTVELPPISGVWIREIDGWFLNSSFSTGNIPARSLGDGLLSPSADQRRATFEATSIGTVVVSFRESIAILPTPGPGHILRYVLQPALCRIQVVVEVATVIDVSGTWRLAVAAQEAGDCFADTFTHVVTIDQDGTDLVVSNVSGDPLTDPGIPWTGTIEGGTVRFGGTLSESGGVTTAAYLLSTDGTELFGYEEWEFTVSGEVVCPGGYSDVTGDKLP